MTTVWVGTVGWSYKDWRGPFYPEASRQADWLTHYVERFRSVEVDSTFHAVPARTTLQRWHDTAPEGFRFATKIPKAISHERDLTSKRSALQSLVRHLGVLRGHLGPLVLQLPPTFGRGRLNDLFSLLEALPIRPGLSVEFQHRSCYSPEMFEVFRTRAIGLVTTDEHTGFLLSGPDVVLRLMGTRGATKVFDRVTIDREAELEAWAGRIEELPGWVENAYVYVGNPYSGHAPATAAALAERLGIGGPPPSPPGQTTMFGDRPG